MKDIKDIISIKYIANIEADILNEFRKDNELSSKKPGTETLIKYGIIATLNRLLNDLE